MASYIQIGSSIDYHNASGKTIPHGTVVALADCVGVTAADIPGGETGTLYLTEVWELPAVGEIAQGQKVYWDVTDACITADSTKSGAVPAGIAVTAKSGAAEGVVRVRLSP